MSHITVFKKEAINFLNIKPGGIYVDLTLGGGGHSLEILDNLTEGTLICFDVDLASILKFIKCLREAKPDVKIQEKKDYWEGSIKALKIYLINDNFENLDKWLQSFKLTGADGILADLGWSSEQLGAIQGLSFDIPFEQLDMRLTPNLNVSAADLLNALGKKELKLMFERYADIYGRLNDDLIMEINSFRRKKLFEKTEDLLRVIGKVARNKKDISFKARVFQALRIAVNQELTALDNLIPKSFNLLNKDGVLVVITFHSGEEKTLLKYFDVWFRENKLTYLSNYAEDNFIRPSVDELIDNYSARSAKLWAIQKV